MSIVDDRVLEYLDENEAGTPAEIRRDAKIPYSGTHVARRLRELCDRGFIKRVSAAPTYMITERGEKYLAGEYDAREHEEKADGGTTLSA